VILAQLLNRAERDRPLAPRLHQGRLIIRPVAQEALGQAHQVLHVPGLGATRVRNRIHHAVLDRPHPHGVRIPDVTHLDRRRPQGHHAQPVPRRVPRQLHQDVDAIVGDPLGDGLIGHGRAVAPRQGQPLQTLRYLVRLAGAEVHVDVERRAVVPGEHRLGEVRHRVPPEVRRQVPDAQFCGPPGAPGEGTGRTPFSSAAPQRACTASTSAASRPGM
jgi:hypothetical protein